MSLTARIADISLTVQSKQEPSFGSLLDGSRKVSFVAKLTGADKDAIAADLVTLNARLANPCDLVLQSTDSSYPQALRLLGGGAASVDDQWRYEFGGDALVRVEAPCEPYAHPANRVYPNPYGDEWPSALITDIARNDASYVYADAGRWCVTADSTDDGQFAMFGDAIPDEVLVVDFDYDVTAASSTNVFSVSLVLRATDGGANLDAWTLFSTAAVGTGHVRKYLRVISTAARCGLYVDATYTDAAVKGYVWNVEIGVRSQATHRLVPGEASTSGGITPDIPYGWLEPSPAVGNVAFTTSGASMRIQANNSAAEAWCSSVTNLTTKAGAIPVTQGRYVGVKYTRQVSSYSAGGFRVRIAWAEADGTIISYTTLTTTTSDDGSPVTFPAAGLGVCSFAVPALAALAYLQFGCTGSGATFNANIGAIEFGEHVLEAPDDIPLAAMLGEAPAPLDIYGDVDVETNDAHSVYLGVMPNDGGAYVFEAEALSWTGTSDAYETSAAMYPGTGNTGWKNSGTNECDAPLDTRKVTPGTYLILARTMTNNASYVGTVGWRNVGDTTNIGSATIALTTPAYISLGQITLPHKRTHRGTAANIEVSITNANASGATSVDRFVLVPLKFGGYAYYHDSTATEAISAFDVEDGDVLLDSAVDMTDCGGGQMLATASDRLIVCSEEVASDETTHAVVLEVLHTPRFNLWR